jgi:hypothetical protein
MRMAIRILVVGLALVALAGWLAGSGRLGSHEEPGEVTRATRPVLPAQAMDGHQILFGDLHVHTTFSADAFLFSLPLFGGEGAHPPADACDFARFCAALDFWSINDHAEALTPRHWRETIDSIRQCNTTAGDPQNPDVVAFLGWEWTQVGLTPETHYGHKNVVLAHTDDERIPTRPIAARLAPTPGFLGRLGLAATLRDRRALELARYQAERAELASCPEGIPVRELPEDCHESAATPAELFARLDELGHAALVIPHGTAWGWSAEPGSDWSYQEHQVDPERQRLIEVFSGHGNSEEYRAWRDVRFESDGSTRCPEPTQDYLPSCWRAGELVRERCEAAGESAEECERRALEARTNHIAAGRACHRTVPGSRAEEWLDAGQCRDCYLPAFDLRPLLTVQSILARGDVQRMGFIASSDIHSGRPGTGYKEFGRKGVMTDALGRVSPTGGGPLAPTPVAREPRSVRIEGEAGGGFGRFELRDSERATSFLYTGGLVGVHADGRSREDVWQALVEKRVYGTSGDRILLWFELQNGGGTPMGSSVTLAEAPRFEVRAVGAFEQKPGCPEYAPRALSSERLERLCRGECYHPSDVRKRIERIEVVRIRPRIGAGEPLETLIEDPWFIFPCADTGDGCRVSFEDPEFEESGRDAVYYVRALQKPSPTVNGAQLRCVKDETGACVRAAPCYGDWRTTDDEECLANAAERAWSSPIWVDQPD